MSADSVPSSKTNIFQSKLIYCRHFRTYSRWAILDWSDTVFRRRNVTRRRISNTVLQPRYWGRVADSPEVCRLWSQSFESNSATYRKTEVSSELSGFYHSIFGFLASYRVSKYKKPREITDEICGHDCCEYHTHICVAQEWKFNILVAQCYTCWKNSNPA